MENLDAEKQPGRASVLWKLGLANQLQGNRSAACQVHTEAISNSEASENNHINILATTCIGYLLELDGQLRLAAETYQRALQLVGEPPGPVACEAYVGLARIHYEWNELDLAEHHGQLSVKLARQLEIASFVSSEVFLARLKIARGDTAGAIATLAQTERDALQRNFLSRIPTIAGLQAQIFIREGNLEAAARLTADHVIPISRARVHLAWEEPDEALAVLEQYRQEAEAEAKEWTDELLRVLILEALTRDAYSEHDEALGLLCDALTQTEAQGFVRSFVDERARSRTALDFGHAIGARAVRFARPRPLSARGAM